jgi:hypothetical protein
MPQIDAMLRPIQLHHLAFLTVVAAVVAVLAWWPNPRPSGSAERCESWDHAASAALSGLIGDASATADAYVGDALFRLRRARRYCRHGFVALARLDYDVLLSNRYRSGR